MIFGTTTQERQSRAKGDNKRTEVQLSSVQDATSALGKAHTHSAPSLRSLPNQAMPLKPWQRSSDCQWTFLTLSSKIVRDPALLLSASAVQKSATGEPSHTGQSVTSQTFHLFLVFLVWADNCSPLAKFCVCR